MARRTLRSTLIGASAGIAIFFAACGGNSDDPQTTPPPSSGGATPIPTASPLASLPPATILDTTGSPDADEPTPDVTYVVVAGDTLSRIAEEFGTSVEALVAANDLPDTDILVGQEILIPGASTGTSVDATPTPTPSTSFQTYVVQPGDTGFGIALEFDTTLEAIAAANGLSIDDLSNLQLGQELLIPN